MSRLLRTFREMIGLLSRGEVSRKLDEEMENCLNALEEMPADKGKAEVTLKVTFEYELGRIDIKADVKSKLPDTTKFVKTPFWIDDGHLSVEHPNQINMFSSPRGVDGDEPEGKYADRVTAAE
ncbi:hypothetical protein [Oricola indica]|uniref:hypothetical protein n=1 Tax=Oricola indica TaxID=2872591 RepID=UPI001CBF7F9F|nr:hypothetical protein [Oricola indica]